MCRRCALVHILCPLLFVSSQQMHSRICMHLYLHSNGGTIIIIIATAAALLYIPVPAF